MMYGCEKMMYCDLHKPDVGVVALDDIFHDRCDYCGNFAKWMDIIPPEVPHIHLTPPQPVMVTDVILETPEA